MADRLRSLTATWLTLALKQAHESVITKAVHIKPEWCKLQCLQSSVVTGRCALPSHMPLCPFTQAHTHTHAGTHKHTHTLYRFYKDVSLPAVYLKSIISTRQEHAHVRAVNWSHSCMLEGFWGLVNQKANGHWLAKVLRGAMRVVGFAFYLGCCCFFFWFF